MNKNHILTISYELIISEEVIQFIKDENGTAYWANDEDAEVSSDDNDDMTVTLEGVTHTFNTETALRGLALWAQSHSQEQLQNVLDMGADHMDCDEIWQLGFFGELVYG